jgi:acyl carrier protein
LEPENEEMDCEIEKIIAEALDVCPHDVVPGAVLKGPVLNMENTDLSCLIFLLNRKFEINISIEEFENIITVQNVVNFVHGKKEQYSSHA